MADEKGNTETQTVSEEDDFEFGGKKGESNKGEGSGDGSGDEGNAGQEGKGVPGKEGSENNSGEQGKKEGEDQGAAVGKEGDGKKNEDGSDESQTKTDDGEGSQKKEEDGKAGGEEGEGAGKGEDGTDTGEGAKKKGDGEGAVDFFADDYKEGGDTAEQSKSFDIKGFAAGFDIETEDPEELKEKISEKIESAKQEVKISDYSPEAQGLLKHLNENKGEIKDFISNKEIAALQGVISMQPEQKVIYVRTQEYVGQGKTRDEAIEQAEADIDEMGTREIKDVADKLNNDAGKLIDIEINKIVGDKDKITSQQNEKAEKKKTKEIDGLKNYINTQENFMGIDLTPKAKQNIVRDIETGEFDKVANNNPASSKFSAYMFAKFGKKIVENYSASASEQNRKGHNAAIDTQTSALHKSKGSAKKGGAGKQQGTQTGTQKNFDSWSDAKMFEEGEE